MSWNFNPYTGEPYPQQRPIENHQFIDYGNPRTAPPVPPQVIRNDYPQTNKQESSVNAIRYAALIVLLMFLLFSLFTLGMRQTTFSHFPLAPLATKHIEPYTWQVPRDCPPPVIGDDGYYIIPDASTGAPGDVIVPNIPSVNKEDYYDPRKSGIEFR